MCSVIGLCGVYYFDDCMCSKMLSAHFGRPPNVLRSCHSDTVSKIRIFGPGNGYQSANNVVLGVLVVIRFSKY